MSGCLDLHSLGEGLRTVNGPFFMTPHNKTGKWEFRRSVFPQRKMTRWLVSREMIDKIAPVDSFILFSLLMQLLGEPGCAAG
jgi:hypothetical protein